jgi:hypothetical protein
MDSSNDPTIDAWWMGEWSEETEGLLDPGNGGVWGLDAKWFIGLEVKDRLG